MGISSKAKYPQFKLLLKNIMDFNAEIFMVNVHTLNTSHAFLKEISKISINSAINMSN